MGVRSFRIPPNLEAGLAQAANLKGMTVSEFVRKALERAIDQEFSQRQAIVSDIRNLSFESGSPPVARRAHEVFGELLDKRFAR